MNKFWGGDGSSSSSSSSSSDSEDDREEKKVETTVRRPQRWAEESSSDEEDHRPRVVQSHTDKRYAQLVEKIGVLKNHQKIDDFASLITDYEALFKMIDKLKNIIDQDGGISLEHQVHCQFIKCISGLEEHVDRLHAEFLEKKQSTGEKLTESKQRAFNTLRAKVRKGNKTYQEQVEQYRADPNKYETEQQAEEDDDSDSEDDSPRRAGGSSSSSSDSDSDSDSSSSDSDSDSSSGSDSDSSSSSSSSSSSGGEKKSWKSATDDTDSDAGGDDDAAREKKMLRWVITPEKHAKREAKKVRDEQEKKGTGKEAKTKKEPKTKNQKKEGKHEEKGEKKEEKKEYTAEELMKKVTEIAQQRGRRGFDRAAYTTSLMELLTEHAPKHGSRAQLYIYSCLVAADFDQTGSAFAAMKIELWNQALARVLQMLPLLIESYENPQDAEDTLPADEIGEWSHDRQQELFVFNVEKLDDELYKALQFTVDVYGAEYQDILANSSKFLMLLKRVLKFFEDSNQAQPLSCVALRMMEQVYYKPDVLNRAVYESIQLGITDEEEKAAWIWPSNSRAFLSQLSRYVFAAGQEQQKRRAALCQAYHLALHDHFQAGRDLLHLGNLQEMAHESGDVHTQILYNRAIAQMGLCAFRLGKIHEAHNCLMDVCQHNKARELLAQGLSYSKNVQDRTPEQERAERLRQFPYHMHINLEVLESAHHICAMLLEVPNLAMQAIDPSNKRIISRVLRRSLDQYEKQLFTGPPENAKESVVCAAKALQRGEWQGACSALEELKLWDHIDPGDSTAGVRVIAMIKDKIKTEALRTYLFAYASIYDAFHLDQLVCMFDLPAKTIHSIVSKMMIKEEITAFWDESSNFVLMQHREPTGLQRLALALADKGAQAVEMNERLVDQKTGGYGIKEQRPATQGRFDGIMGMKGRGKGSLLDLKGKGKGRGKGAASGPPRYRGWENARAGAIRGNAQRGWATNKV